MRRLIVVLLATVVVGCGDNGVEDCQLVVRDHDGPTDFYVMQRVPVKINQDSIDIVARRSSAQNFRQIKVRLYEPTVVYTDCPTVPFNG